MKREKKIVFGEILTEPITPAIDPIALEANRVELYEQAQEIARLNSMVLKNKIRSDEEYEETRRLNEKVKENTRKAEAARIDLETQIKQIQEERKRWALRDTVPPRHINFDSTLRKRSQWPHQRTTCSERMRSWPKAAMSTSII